MLKQYYKQYYKPHKPRARYWALLGLVIMVIGVVFYYIHAPLITYESDLIRSIQGSSAIVGMGFACLIISMTISTLEDRIKMLEKALNEQP